jgi:CubicO group peptidase (beta-lactamase class C family)
MPRKNFSTFGNYKLQMAIYPQQKPSLAGGLKMNALDFAKFGQLYKNNGIWNGKSILDKTWIKKSFTNYFH